MTGENAADIQDTLSRIVTLMFHPLLMPLYALCIIFFAPTLMFYLPGKVKKILFLVVLINNVAFPLAMLPFLKFRSLISSWTMDERSERTLPLLFMSILYSITSILMFRFQIPVLLKSFAFATSILSLTLTVLNFWYKISLHAAGAGALTAVVLILTVKMHTSLTWYLIAVLILSGFILSGRLRLNIHNPVQVWTGYFTGLSVLTASMLLF
jgi:hypothetical protein